MLNVLKLFLKRIILKSQKCIVFDQLSEINYNVVNNSINVEYPCVIVHSKCNFEVVNEGCRISESGCYGNVLLGRFVSITGPGTVIKSLGNKIHIGSFSSIGQNVCIVDFNHSLERMSSSFIHHAVFKEEFTKDILTKGPVTIEEDVWIGSNTVILPGLKIGRGSVIGAGSIVTADIPRYSIAAGNPARVIAKRFNDDVVGFVEELKWWEWDIEKILKNRNYFVVDLKNTPIEKIRSLVIT